MKQTSKNILLIITVLVGLISCNRIQYPDRQNLTRLNDTTPLNGYFRNIADDSNKISMWRVLSMADRYKKPRKEYDVPNSYVQLVGKDKHLIVAKLFIDTSLIAERHFKGKIKGDYFVTRRKIKYFGFPLIYGMEADCKLQFSKDADSNLLIDDSFSSIGWLFIMMSGVNSQDNYKYEPK